MLLVAPARMFTVIQQKIINSVIKIENFKRRTGIAKKATKQEGIAGVVM